MQNSKKADDKEKAKHIKMLASKYPGLRISYVDEKDGAFYSVLSKSSDTGDGMEEEYRIQVSGGNGQKGGRGGLSFVGSSPYVVDPF